MRTPLQGRGWTCSYFEISLLTSNEDIEKPAIGAPFRAVGVMEHRALVERVNQDYANVRKEQTEFVIEYPIQRLASSLILSFECRDS